MTKKHMHSIKTSCRLAEALIVQSNGMQIRAVAFDVFVIHDSLIDYDKAVYH